MSSASNPQSDADQLEAAADQAIAEGGQGADRREPFSRNRAGEAVGGGLDGLRERPRELWRNGLFILRVGFSELSRNGSSQARLGPVNPPL